MKKIADATAILFAMGLTLPSLPLGAVQATDLPRIAPSAIAADDAGGAQRLGAPESSNSQGFLLQPPTPMAESLGAMAPAGITAPQDAAQTFIADVHQVKYNDFEGDRRQFGDDYFTAPVVALAPLADGGLKVEMHIAYASDYSISAEALRSAQEAPTVLSKKESQDGYGEPVVETVTLSNKTVTEEVDYSDFVEIYSVELAPDLKGVVSASFIRSWKHLLANHIVIEADCGNFRPQ
jgi:hypothetical protein